MTMMKKLLVAAVAVAISGAAFAQDATAPAAATAPVAQTEAHAPAAAHKAAKKVKAKKEHAVTAKHVDAMVAHINKVLGKAKDSSKLAKNKKFMAVVADLHNDCVVNADKNAKACAGAKDLLASGKLDAFMPKADAAKTTAKADAKKADEAKTEAAPAPAAAEETASK